MVTMGTEVGSVLWRLEGLDLGVLLVDILGNNSDGGAMNQHGPTVLSRRDQAL